MSHEQHSSSFTRNVLAAGVLTFGAILPNSALASPVETGPEVAAATACMPSPEKNITSIVAPQAGFFLLRATGQIESCGTAGSLPDVNMPVGENAASLAVRTAADGQLDEHSGWVFGDKGSVIAFGGAPYFGDMSKTSLNGPIVGSAATPSGEGYYMVGSDGGIFAFGDANFNGSMGGKQLNKKVVGMIPANNGYMLVAADGGIFAFGGRFLGSAGIDEQITAAHSIVGVTAKADGSGYWMVRSDGAVFGFGSTSLASSSVDGLECASTLVLAESQINGYDTHPNIVMIDRSTGVTRRILAAYGSDVKITDIEESPDCNNALVRVQNYYGATGVGIVDTSKSGEAVIKDIPGDRMEDGHNYQLHLPWPNTRMAQFIRYFPSPVRVVYDMSSGVSSETDLPGNTAVDLPLEQTSLGTLENIPDPQPLWGVRSSSGRLQPLPIMDGLIDPRVSPTNRSFVAGTYFDPDTYEANARVVDISSGRVMATLEGLGTYALQVAWLNDGTLGFLQRLPGQGRPNYQIAIANPTSGGVDTIIQPPTGRAFTAIDTQPTAS